MIAIFTLLSVTAGLIYSAEFGVNPDIPDYFTALYFALTTISTVGFGEIAPATNAGRLVVSGSILIGVAVLPAQAAALVESLRERTEDNTQTEETKSSDDLTLRYLDSRLRGLEEKLDEVNERMDHIIDILDSKSK